MSRAPCYKDVAPISETMPQSDVELHHLHAVRGLVAHLLLHLGLVLLVLQKGQHLCMLLLDALHVHEVSLGVGAQGLLLLLDLFELGLGALALGTSFHEHGGSTFLH